MNKSLMKTLTLAMLLLLLDEDSNQVLSYHFSKKKKDTNQVFAFT